SEWTSVRVEMMPFGHIFRAGSRIRLSVDTPGDSASEWFFIPIELDDTVVQSVGHSDGFPSSVVLPVIPSIDVPTPLADCGTLRGQPCRDFVPHENTAAE
ncbi:MAG: hypothetical protein ACI9OJ_001409, partial [Myxococcota bacterium]